MHQLKKVNKKENNRKGRVTKNGLGHYACQKKMHYFFNG